MKWCRPGFWYKGAHGEVVKGHCRNAKQPQHEFNALFALGLWPLSCELDGQSMLQNCLNMIKKMT